MTSVLEDQPSQVRIRDLQVDEADVVGKFFHEHWRPNHIFFRNRELLFWQYRNNPYASLFTDGLTFRAAMEKGDLIGVFGYMPFVFNRYGTRQYGCNLSAWWVHPNHRRGSLGLSLLHSLQQDSPFDACIAGINTPTAEKIYLRMSWVVVPCIPRLVFIADREAFADLVEPGKSIPATTMPSVETKTGASIEVSRLPSFDSLVKLDWDSFYWQKIAPSQMGPAREVSYLRWRYEQIPLFQYDALVATDRQGVAGLLVYRIERVQGRQEIVIRLVDLIAKPPAVSALLRSLIQLARERHAALIDFFCTYSPYLDQLRESGFVDASESSGERYWCPFLFQPLDHARNRLNTSWWIRNVDLTSQPARADFCIMKGDYEFDRPN